MRWSPERAPIFAERIGWAGVAWGVSQVAGSPAGVSALPTQTLRCSSRSDPGTWLATRIQTNVAPQTMTAITPSHAAVPRMPADRDEECPAAPCALWDSASVLPQLPKCQGHQGEPSVLAQRAACQGRSTACVVTTGVCASSAVVARKLGATSPSHSLASCGMAQDHIPLPSCALSRGCAFTPPEARNIGHGLAACS